MVSCKVVLYKRRTANLFSPIRGFFPLGKLYNVPSTLNIAIRLWSGLKWQEKVSCMSTELRGTHGQVQLDNL